MLEKFRFSENKSQNRNFIWITIFGIIATLALIFQMLIVLDLVDNFLRYNYKANKAEVLHLYNNNFTSIESFREMFDKEKNINKIIRWYDDKRTFNLIGRKELIFIINNKEFVIEYPPILKNEKLFVSEKINSDELNTYLNNTGIDKNELMKIIDFLIQHNLKAIGQGDGDFQILSQSDVYLKYLPTERLVEKEGNRIMQNLGFNWYMTVP